MTPEEMRNKSATKVKQIMELMAVLHLKVEARERINEQGFIEKLVFWIDDEKYPPMDGPIPQSVIEKEAAPAPAATGENAA